MTEPTPEQLTGTKELVAKWKKLRVRRLVRTRAADITPLNTAWAWQGRLPLGAVSLFVGQPGLGKSTLTTELAAQITRGKLEGDLYGTPRTVLIATAEDALAQTVVPRLTAAEADLDRIEFVTISEDGIAGSVALPDDVAYIVEAAQATGARMLVLDPLVALLPGKIDAHRDQDVRRAIAPLAKLAEEEDIAVVGIFHLNKGQSRDVLMRASGSIAFVAAARSVLLLAADPGDADGERGRERILAHRKCSVGPSTRSLTCRIEGRELLGENGVISTSRLMIVGESDLDAADLLGGSAPDEEASALAEAVAFLQQELAEVGRCTSKTIHRKAREAGHTKRTLERAKRQLGVKAVRRYSEWWWELPEDAA